MTSLKKANQKRKNGKSMNALELIADHTKNEIKVGLKNENRKTSLRNIEDNKS